ncbi:VOC family protein [Nocardioides sp. 1609]|uniref:VOC family protein n=1 Tax=Nocardioides sp. 1609 TaxID=2508327 RepID=UPI00106FFB55|nr:VOC family protein [Nocardioides sp. 1609]
MTTDEGQVRQLRVVLEVPDFDEAVAFFRDALGLPESAAFATGGEDRVAILEAGRATLELASPAHRRAIDAVEDVADGGTAAIRLAFEVDDAGATTARLVAAGARHVAGPVLTPWRSLNARLDAPADQQITVFEETETPEERTGRAGFATDAVRD